MMCTGKCHKITEHVYLVVIDEYADSNIDSPNRGKSMKLSYVLSDYNPLNKAIFGKGYNEDYRKLNSKKYRPMAARKESRNVLSGRR